MAKDNSDWAKLRGGVWTWVTGKAGKRRQVGMGLSLQAVETGAARQLMTSISKQEGGQTPMIHQTSMTAKERQI